MATRILRRLTGSSRARARPRGDRRARGDHHIINNDPAGVGFTTRGGSARGWQHGTTIGQQRLIVSSRRDRLGGILPSAWRSA